MIFSSLPEIAQASLEIIQSFALPVLGVCMVVSVLFFIFQLTLSFHDLNLQFLIRFSLLILLCVFMAKSVSTKFIEFSRAVFESAPGLVR